MKLIDKFYVCGRLITFGEQLSCAVRVPLVDDAPFSVGHLPTDIRRLAALASRSAFLAVAFALQTLAFAFHSSPLTFIGEPLAGIGTLLSLVGDSIAFVGDPIALVGEMLSLLQIGLAALDGGQVRGERRPRRPSDEVLRLLREPARAVVEQRASTAIDEIDRTIPVHVRGEEAPHTDAREPGGWRAEAAAPIAEQH
ncbi:MAG TPA: hypothetical protein PLV92_27655, partial [Pirellulaceae bacterium]|nr:hypothetical protein [Pirellulaceae bacterium]